MNHTLPRLFHYDVYSCMVMANVQSMDGLQFGNHEKTAAWMEKGVNYFENENAPHCHVA